MPYASMKQARLFHALERRGEMPHKTVEEFDAATDFKHLPARIAAKRAFGGAVGPQDDDGAGMVHCPRCGAAFQESDTGKKEPPRASFQEALRRRRRR